LHSNTGGYAWRIFLIVMGVTLPVVIMVGIVAGVAVGILSLIIGDAGIGSGTFRAIGMLWGVFGILFLYTVGVVIASRLYQWIGVRVKERGSDS
jgi:hypothetical protein